MVRTPACHAGGRRFEPVLGRHVYSKARAFLYKSGVRRTYAAIAQSVEHAAVNRGVVGSSPTGGAREWTVTITVAVRFILSGNKLGPLAQLVRAAGS